MVFGLLLGWSASLVCAEEDPILDDEREVVDCDESGRFGPIIPRIEVEDGTALDVINQIRASLPADEPAGFLVELSEAELRLLRVSLLELRSVPLGLALQYLCEATNGGEVANRGGLWVLEKINWDRRTAGLRLVSYNVSLEELQTIGLVKVYGGKFETETGGEWPEGKSSSVQFFEASSTLLLRAPERAHRDFEAILRLRRSGYTELKLKR